MEKKDVVAAVARFRDGARPFSFRRPNWFFITDDGGRYPLKYIYAMALGIDPLDTHTDEAKKCIQGLGYQIVNDAEVLTPASFWWVNHKQTHLDEYAGGYIWSPKTKKNGDANEGYLNLTRVKVGDRIISYAEGVIKSIGVVTHSHVEAPIPQTHQKTAEYWAKSGWQVSIEWVPLTVWLCPKNFLDRIVPLLPSMHSPIQKNGDGNLCYLSSISSELGRLILSLAIEVDPTATQAVHEIEIEGEEALEELCIQASDLPDTEKQQLVRSRIGQGIFRMRVANQERKCRLTGVDNLAFLIASHIKPWRHSDNDERLNGSNGLLLSPHVDKLFDRGWISFSDDGHLLIAEQARSVAEAWGLAGALNVGAFNSKQRPFLKYHREKIFKGA
ncbi:HNH endonuclease [Pseudomonas sp. PDM31]|uniref:HNH endonuclease n=1 Tax=Pseudomonas sp. PDM31 TaxID=2854778 RepID=UPI001C46940D|nr:HNH endonuclease [Pseudomonas sp. PDM31]MBV7478245.1 HNH endonuclease [Pseudomonas sp. PDM31]